MLWGPKEIGTVHPISFHADDRGGPVILSLGGRSWQVGHIDWEHQAVQVTPADEFGKSRWLGESRPISNRLCQAIRAVLLDLGERPWWSKRAKGQIASARENSSAVSPDSTVVEIDRKRERVVWWTFAGLNANFELAAAWHGTARFDNFSITFDGCVLLEGIQEWIRNGSPINPLHFARLPCPKFHGCLPAEVLTDMIRARVHDAMSVEIARGSQILYRDFD